MKVLLKILLGILAVGGFLYWLASVFFRPAKKWKSRHDRPEEQESALPEEKMSGNDD